MFFVEAAAIATGIATGVHVLGYRGVLAVLSLILAFVLVVNVATTDYDNDPDDDDADTARRDERKRRP